MTSTNQIIVGIIDIALGRYADPDATVLDLTVPNAPAIEVYAAAGWLALHLAELFTEALAAADDDHLTVTRFLEDMQLHLQVSDIADWDTPRDA